MKKENLMLTICFGIMLVISFGLLLIHQAFVPNSQVDKLFNQKVVLSEEEYIIKGNIISKQEVKSVFGKKLGTLYTTSTKNSFGSIELLINIDENNRVKVLDQKIDQTKSFIKQIRTYILQNYQDIYYENIQFIDGAAGATTIGVSRKTIKETVEEVVNHHLGIETEPTDYIYQLLNETYTTISSREEDNIFITKVESSKGIHTVYKITDKGLYFGSQEGNATLLVAVNEENLITHTLLPMELYEHTESFATHVTDYLYELLDTPITNPLLPGSGATNSITLIISMIEKIQEVHNE